jgi:hypothetical protein
MVGAVPPVQMVGPPAYTGPKAGLVWLNRAVHVKLTDGVISKTTVLGTIPTTNLFFDREQQ